METEHARVAETRPPRTLFPSTWLTAQCQFGPRGEAPSVFTTGHAQTAGRPGGHASVLCTLQGRLADKKTRASLLRFKAERKVPPQVHRGVSHNPRSGEFIKGREGRRPTDSSERTSSRVVPHRRQSCDRRGSSQRWGEKRADLVQLRRRHTLVTYTRGHICEAKSIKEDFLGSVILLRRTHFAVAAHTRSKGSPGRALTRWTRWRPPGWPTPGRVWPAAKTTPPLPGPVHLPGRALGSAWHSGAAAATARGR